MPFCPWVAAEKPWVLLRASGGGVGSGALLDVLSGASSGAQSRAAAGFWTHVFDFGDDELAADSREHPAGWVCGCSDFPGCSFC